MELSDALEDWNYNNEKIIHVSTHQIWFYLEINALIKNDEPHLFVNLKTKEELQIKDGEPCSCQDEKIINEPFLKSN